MNRKTGENEMKEEEEYQKEGKGSEKNSRSRKGNKVGT